MAVLRLAFPVSIMISFVAARFGGVIRRNLWRGLELCLLQFETFGEFLVADVAGVDFLY